jgi:hypothetical protein
MVSRTIAPIFFEPGTPPSVLPVPTCQTNLSWFAFPQPTIIWTDEVPVPSSKRYTPQISGCTSSRVPSAGHLTQVRLSSPYIRSASKPPKVAFTSPDPVHAGPSRSRSGTPGFKPSDLSEPSTQSSSEAPSNLSEDGLIPKPPGNVAHPGRGGYNLQRALSWPESDYIKLQVYLFVQ